MNLALRAGRQENALSLGGPTSRHLLIAGTGRAGTSFLVRYLTALGMDTHLARNGHAAFWDPRAEAGLEDTLLAAPPGTAPYVVKSPWLFEHVDALLADGRFALDGVIIPVRRLADAAASRVAIEMQAQHAAQPGLAGAGAAFTVFANTPGGAFQSLEPVDQARLLAVGFHHLLERLVETEIPVTLLAFPRVVTDAAYAFRTLREFLPPTVTEDEALAAHARLADPAKVRVRSDPTVEDRGQTMPSRAEVEVMALRREIQALRDRLGTEDAPGAGLLAPVTRRLRRSVLWTMARAVRNELRSHPAVRHRPS